MCEPTTFDRMVDRYTEGQVPWDDPLPPPEVVDFLAERPPGKALDLGCGYGRSTLYLARQGWQVDGVDFVPQAIAETARRMVKADLRQQVRLHIASVSNLDFLAGPYDFVLDVGCMHALDEAELITYRDGVRRLLKENGRYLLYARLRQTDAAPDGPRGVPEATIRDLFGDGFLLERYERGETQVEDKPAWSSGWFWFKRQAA